MIKVVCVCGGDDICLKDWFFHLYLGSRCQIDIDRLEE